MTEFYANAAHQEQAPPRLHRRAIPDYVRRRHGFKVSYRTVEAWPVPWEMFNGRAYVNTAALDAYISARLSAAPVIRGGRRAQQVAA